MCLPTVFSTRPASAGKFVILHRLLPATVIADFMRFDDQGLLAEHWDVVQRLPEPGYDPM